MKVLAVIPLASAACSMIFTERQVAALRLRGIDVTTFYLRSRLSPPLLFADFLKLRRVIEHQHPDVIHAHYGTATAFFCAFSNLVPLIVTFRGSDLLQIRFARSKLRSTCGLLLSQLSILRAKRVVTVSKQLRERLWWGSWKCRVVPSGVDFDRFVPIERDVARERLSWPNNQFVVLFNQGVDPYIKRIELARAAIEKTKLELNKVRLYVLDGGMPPEMMPTVINASDVVLCTSLSEGSPNIVKEALACNVPVVSVDVGDVREQLEGVSYSRVVESSPDAIAKALIDVLTLSLRSNGRSVTARNSLDETTSQYIQIYEEVLMGS